MNKTSKVLNLEKKTSKELWLEEERVALKELSEEKQKYMSRPNDHSLYEKNWEKFWKKKCKEHGGKIKNIDLKEEWRQVWMDYLDSEYRKKMNDKKRELRKKWGLSEDEDINKKTSDVVTLSESDKDDDDIVELKYPPPPEVHSVPSTSKVSVDVDIKPSITSDQKIKAESGSSLPSYEVPSDELNVLSLLKILSALQNKGLVFGLSDKIEQAKSFALKLEDKRHGDSQLMVDIKVGFYRTYSRSLSRIYILCRL